MQRELKLPALLVTHDAAEATALADTVILCEGGRVIRQYEPGKVFTEPNGQAADRL